MTDNNTAWPIKNSEGADKHILPAGRYKCKLNDIRLITTPVYGKPDETEPKLVFEFKPERVQVPAGKSCDITAFVRPVNGIKGNMYKLLCQMSLTGTMPEEVRMNSKRYQDFAMSFIGKRFIVTSTPSNSGKHNICTGIAPLEGDVPEVQAEADNIPF